MLSPLTETPSPPAATTNRCSLGHPQPVPPRQLKTLDGHTGTSRAIELGTPNAVAFAKDGQTLASISDNRTVLLWDVRDLAQPQLLEELAGHTGQVTAVAFAPNGHTLASASEDRTALLWDTTDPNRPRPFDTPLIDEEPMYGAELHPGRPHHCQCRMGRDGTALGHLRPERTTAPQSPFTDHTGEHLAVTPDGRTLVTPVGNTAALWDIGDPTRPQFLGDLPDGHIDSVHDVAVAPDGRILATASVDKTVLLWDISDPTHPRRVGQPLVGHTDSVYAVAFSPDSRTLASGSGDTTVRLWDVSNPAQPHSITAPLTGDTLDVYALAFAPDGRTLASGGGDDTVRLWDTTDPTHPRPRGEPLTGHQAEIYTMEFSPDGNTLATGGDDQTVLLWDLADPGVRAASATPSVPTPEP